MFTVKIFVLTTIVDSIVQIPRDLSFGMNKQDLELFQLAIYSFVKSSCRY